MTRILVSVLLLVTLSGLLAVPAMSFVQPMQVGSTGPAVLELQTDLRRAGFDPGPLDGRFGPRTAAALRTFQASAGLEANGVAGAATRTRLQTEPRTYQVVAGDTLAGIAGALGVNVDRLVQLNQLPDPNLLAIGQVLKLPPLHQDKVPVHAATNTPQHPSRPTVSGSPAEAKGSLAPDPMVVQSDGISLHLYVPAGATAARESAREAAVAQPVLASRMDPSAAGQLGMRAGDSADAIGEPLFSVPGDAQGRVALTFNMGERLDPLALAIAITALAVVDARATFFVTGQAVLEQPDLARDLVQRGHELGLQGYGGASLTELPPPALQTNLDLAQKAVIAATGVPARFLRTPGGQWHQPLLAAAQAQHLRVTLWSSIGLRDRGTASKVLAYQAAQSAFPGAILMLHGDEPATLAALPVVLQAIRDAGRQLVTLSELLGGDNAGQDRP